MGQRVWQSPRIEVRGYAHRMEHLDQYPDLPRVESPEDEAHGRAWLSQSFDRVERLHSAFADMSVRQRSSLHGHDLATPREPLSHQVYTAVGVAFDNLRTIKVLMADAHVLPVFAHFGLIRNALEAPGVALWMLGPTSRDVRVLRSLQLAYEDRLDQWSLELEVDGNPYVSLPPTDAIANRLLEIRDLRPVNSGVSLNPPSITKRLAVAQAFVPPQEVTLLASWKIMSGVAHGRRGTLYNLLDRTVTGVNPLGAEIRMTSSVRTIATMYMVAEKYLLALMNLMILRGYVYAPRDDQENRPPTSP